jgi:ribose-phosphate pyrophosphokinase
VPATKHDAEALSLIGDVKGSDVIVVDDEVDTGSSIIQAIKVAKENGALDIYLAFVHAILSGDAAQSLAALPLKRIITTDTVPISDKQKVQDRLTVLTVSGLLGEVIRRAHEGRSVGEMFNE